MVDTLAMGRFEVFQTTPGNWFDGLLSVLIQKCGVADKARSSVRLMTLLYHAQRLGVRSIVMHTGYICPDYQGDYAALYSRMARPPAPRSVRLLFFTQKKTAEEVFLLPPGPVPSENDWNEYIRQVGFVGFAVIRPTPDCIVGRTVLAPHPDDGFFPCVDAYPAHLYGIPRYACGVPWLEQDPSRFVCGGAALWTCAFHTQTRWGLPHYSPGELTAMARQFVVSGHISGGMTGTEMATAIKEWGFMPYSYVCTDSDAAPRLQNLFAAAHALLESRISVIIGCWPKGGSGHAVVAMGHGLRDTVTNPDHDGEVSLRSTSDWIDRWVVEMCQSYYALCNRSYLVLSRSFGWVKAA